MSEQLISTPSTFGENANFVLERELGTGGMGGVYMGRDKMLDRPVAVKVMQKEYGADAEFVEKFKKEAQAAAKLIHPNIAQIYSYGICDGMPYIAMELATGGSLYSITQANPGKTDVTRVLKICQQVAQALQCASDQGLVHGDVKPENILLDANGNAKLVDFGLAAMQKDTDEIWGTPYYISPEKVNKEPIDFRADIYSLGGTLYHALTGVAPFEGDDAIAVVKKRFEGMPQKPSEIRSEITPAIDSLVMKMLAFNKDERYPSFEALLEAFKEVLSVGLTPTTSTPRPATTTGGRRVMMRGRRTVMMKRPGAATAAAAVEKKDADADSAEPGEIPEIKNEEDDEEEGGGNLALKVVGVIVGVIVLIGAVVGGLIWYQVADKKARAREEQSQIAGGCDKARIAIRDTVQSAIKFADEFDNFAKRAVDECQKPTDELEKILPSEQANLLKPATSKELEDAIAATNETAVATPPPAAPAPAATNAAPAAATSNAVPAKAAAAATNKAPAKVEAPAKEAAPAKDEKPAAETPQVVITMNELWERAYGCQACAVRIRHAVRQIVKKSKEADKFVDSTRENMDQLAALSRTLVDMLDQVKTSKDVETVKKGITFIKSKGESTVQQTTKRLRIEKLEQDRKAKAEAQAAREKEMKEKAEAEKKTLVEAESKTAADKFETLSAQGNFRLLDWKGAIRQLENVKSEFKTAEGQLAADLQIRKVKCMKSVQDILIRHLPSKGGFTFKRAPLKGCKVTKATEKDIELARGKQKHKITWQKFYKDNNANFFEAVGQFIYNGRKNAGLGKSDVADALVGAALTFQIVFSEEASTPKRVESLAQQAVKEFPEFAKTAQAIFPDMKFEAAEE